MQWSSAEEALKKSDEAIDLVIVVLSAALVTLLLATCAVVWSWQ